MVRSGGRSTSMVTAAMTSSCGSASGRGSEDVVRQPPSGSLRRPGQTENPKTPGLRTLKRKTRKEAYPFLPDVAMRPFIEEEYREAFVEIYEAAPEPRLVTSIEVL